MKNGFIYLAFNWIVQKLRFLNLVELFKLVIIKIFADGTEQDMRIKGRIAIDVFQVFKWLLIALLIGYGATGAAFRYVVYYMISANLYTYFYHHVWGSNFSQSSGKEYIRSRFLNTILAIAYFLVCYSYLYLFQFQSAITWPNGQVDLVNSIYLSVANAFTLTYGGFMPNTQAVRVLFMTELLNTFVFFTIILSSSVPNPVTKEK